LLGRDQYERVEVKRERVSRELDRLSSTYLPLNGRLREMLEDCGLPPITRAMTARELLRRQRVDYQALVQLGLGDPQLDPESGQQVEIEAKYETYIARQAAEVERIMSLEQRPIPQEIDYDEVVGLSNEAREKLQRFRPLTLGQASRISGVTPSDMGVLMVYLERRRKSPFRHRKGDPAVYSA
ncbi:MAG: tRNA uridine-5-carboxymethylaminomethyl(34) synthesis enzyme MnmG, partial [Dehalococcoidia bacterium]